MSSLPTPQRMATAPAYSSPVETPSPADSYDARLRRHQTFLGYAQSPLQQPEMLLSRHSNLFNLLLQHQNSTPDVPNVPPATARSTRRQQSSSAADLSVPPPPHLRFDRLIGKGNARYEWEQYLKTPEELKAIKKKSLREYYEKRNAMAQRYIYIDKLLDSTLPHDLLETYAEQEQGKAQASNGAQESSPAGSPPQSAGPDLLHKKKRRPSYLYRVADEESPLLGDAGEGGGGATAQARIVKIAIYVNLVANTVLLIAKLLVAVLSSSLSVVASLVDGALDFLSTAIVWTTTRLMENKDQSRYPVGRNALEPLGILIFSVIMVTSFVQVGIEGFERLLGRSHSTVALGPVVIGIMTSTIVVKGACWVWCRTVRNSSVQALASDAVTDVIFNFFSILFPLVGTYADVWWLDPLGAIVLSGYVIVSWSRICKTNIQNLTGATASMDDLNTLLYLTMRFAKSINQITYIAAYHAGDKLNVEVDLILDPSLELKDSHDLGESLQYVIESLPIVDRAFVHLDYDSSNPPGHLW